MDARKKRILMVGAVFIALVIMAAIFSNTIYSYGLPSVVLGFAQKQSLTYVATGKGYVKSAEEYNVYAPSSGIIGGLPKKGTLLNLEDELFTVVPEAEQEGEEDVRNKLFLIEQYFLDIQEIEDEIVNINKNISYLKDYNEMLKENENLTDDSFNTFEFDSQIELYNRKIAIAQKDADRAAVLYREGVISASEWEAAENSLRDLELGQSQAISAKNNAIEKHNEEREKALDSRQNQSTADALTLEQTISNEENKISSLNIKKEKTLNEIAKLQEGAINMHAKSVFCEKTGIVTQVDYENGADVSKNSRVIKVSPIKGMFESDITVESGAEHIMIGDRVAITVEGNRLYHMMSEVAGKYQEDGVTHVRVAFDANDLYGGEIVRLNHSIVSATMENVVPNNAIRQGAGSDYILVAVKTEGAFFDEYHAEKVDVAIIGYDHVNTAFVPSFKFEGPIIFYSDGIVMNGNRIKIAGENDIIDKR